MSVFCSPTFSSSLLPWDETRPLCADVQSPLPHNPNFISQTFFWNLPEPSFPPGPSSSGATVLPALDLPRGCPHLLVPWTPNVSGSGEPALNFFAHVRAPDKLIYFQTFKSHLSTTDPKMYPLAQVSPLDSRCTLATVHQTPLLGTTRRLKLKTSGSETQAALRNLLLPHFPAQWPLHLSICSGQKSFSHTPHPIHQPSLLVLPSLSA